MANGGDNAHFVEQFKKTHTLVPLIDKVYKYLMQNDDLKKYLEDKGIHPEDTSVAFSVFIASLLSMINETIRQEEDISLSQLVETLIKTQAIMSEEGDNIKNMVADINKILAASNATINAMEEADNSLMTSFSTTKTLLSNVCSDLQKTFTQLSIKNKFLNLRNSITAVIMIIMFVSGSIATFGITKHNNTMLNESKRGLLFLDDLKKHGVSISFGKENYVYRESGSQKLKTIPQQPTITITTPPNTVDDVKLQSFPDDNDGSIIKLYLTQ